MSENAPPLAGHESLAGASEGSRSFWERTRLSPAATVADSAFLVAVAASTAVLWIGRLGFYLDDWDFLRAFRFSPDQSIRGLFQAALAAVPGGRMRPLQLLYTALSYKAWGARPLGYHAAEIVVLSAIGILIWALLRELGRPRVWALSAAILYLTLPHYTTARFWPAAQPFLLSVLLYLTSFYADIRSLRSRKRALLGWRVLAVSTLIGCLLAYEVALPLFAMNIAAALFLGRRSATPNVSRRRTAIVLSDAAALIGVMLFKIATMTRGGVEGDYVSHGVRLVRDVIVVNWVGYGFELPLRVWRAAGRYPDARIMELSFGVALAVALYLWRVCANDRTPSSNSREIGTWLGIGLVAFALGEAIFLVTDQGAGAGNLSMAAPSNRVEVAAALGIAVCLLAGAALLARVFPPAWRGPAFAAAIGLLVLGDSLLVQTVARFWADAYGKEMAVLDAIRERFPSLAAPRTLILDGVCPYVGPAPVLHTDYDLAGMLALAYGDPALRANVVSHRLAVRHDGLATEKYGHQDIYPFSEDLILFDARSGSAVPLPDRATARSYFNSRREPKCPPREIF